MKASACYALIVGSVILNVAMLALMIGSWMWLQKLSKDTSCACAVSKKAVYMRYFLLYAIIVTVLTAGYGIASLYKSQCSVVVYPTLLLMLQSVMFVATIVFVVFAWQYMALLKKSQCSCATTGYGDNLLRIYTIIQTIVLAFTAFTILLGIFLTIILMINFTRTK